MTVYPTMYFDTNQPIKVNQTAQATPSPVSQPTTAFDPENYRGVFDQPTFVAPEVEAVVEEKKTQKSLFVWGIVASIAIKVLL